jgi:hypothetical protein
MNSTRLIRTRLLGYIRASFIERAMAIEVMR